MSIVFGVEINWNNKRFIKKLKKRLGITGGFLGGFPNYDSPINLGTVRNWLKEKKVLLSYLKSLNDAMTKLMADRIVEEVERKQAEEKLKFLENL